MALFKPTYAFNRVTDITLEFLEEIEVKAILLDVDNTIVSYVSKTPIDGSLSWVESLEAAGYKVYIVSNNYRDRVTAVAKTFSLPFTYLGLKPLPFGFMRAKKAMSVRSKDCLVVGDQIFTDILGANLSGMKSVLLTPVEIETGWNYKLRRNLEKKLKRKYNIKEW